MKDEMKRTAAVGEAEVATALQTLQKYKSAKASLEKRVVADEEWWKLRGDGGEEYEKTAWLFNAVANKHADAMDNYPSPLVLPREAGDAESAGALSEIIPAVLENCGFDRVYSEVWYDKLRHGTGCYGVFWDPSMSGGRGDVRIRKIDILNLFWESGISDLQKSKNLFYAELWDTEDVRARYPDVGEISASPEFDCTKYLCDETPDSAGKCAVIDWYYKKRRGGRDILHLCKFTSGKVLFASENDPKYENGIYAHGLYPFFFDKLYTVQGSPCGFGFVDVMKGAQSQIDRLSSAIVKNAETASAVRYFIRSDGSVNEEEFADFTKPLVHVQGSRLGEDSLRQIKVSSLDPLYVSILNNKIEELKETAGNRDFSQGGTTGGITAASAIAALQEAGNKLARDMISGTYSVYKEIIKTVIELIREFYTVPRMFRILGKDGGYSFVTYSSSSIAKRKVEGVFGLEFGSFEPIFDVSVSAEKQSPFARVTQNELAKEFFTMGLFAPSRREEALCCLSMMDFEGKDRIVKKIAEGEMTDGESAAEKTKSEMSDAVSNAVRRAASLERIH